MNPTRRYWIFGIIFIILTGLLYRYLAKPVEFANDIVVSGNYAYLAIGQQGIKIVEISDPENPKQAGYITSVNDPQALFVEDNFLYVAGGKAGIFLYDITQPESPVLVTSEVTSGNALDVVVKGEYAYIANGRSGLAILNVTNHKQFRKIGALDFTSKLGANNGAIALIILDKYAYLSNTSRKSIAIISIDNPRQPKVVGEFKTNTIVHQIIHQAGILYLAADSAGLLALAINTPDNLQLISQLKTNGTVRGFGAEGSIGYIADSQKGIISIDVSNPSNLKIIAIQTTYDQANQLAIKDDFVYIANGYTGLTIIKPLPSLEINQSGISRPQFNILDTAKSGNKLFLAAGEHGVRVLDIQNPQGPREISQFQTSGYVSSIKTEGDLAYLADQGKGLTLLDISDPFQISEYGHGYTTGQETNQIIVSKPYVYLSEGAAGLTIIDTTNPLSPTLASALNTNGNAVGIALYNSKIYLANGGGGLQVIDVTDPRTPNIIGNIKTPGDARGVAVLPIRSLQNATAKIFVYVAAGSRGVQIVDATNPKNLKIVGSKQFPDTVWNVAIDQGRLFVSNGLQGLRILSLDDFVNLKEISYVDTLGQSRSSLVDGNTVFVADLARGLRVIDITKITAPVEAGSFDSPAQVKDMVVANSNAYVLDGKNGLWVFNLAEPSNIYKVGSTNLPCDTKHLTIQDQTVWIACGAKGVLAINISDPISPVVVGKFDTPGDANSILVRNHKAFVADGPKGITILDITNLAEIKPIRRIENVGDIQYMTEVDNYFFAVSLRTGMIAFKENDSGSLVEVGRFTEFKDVYKISITWPYAYLAGGVDGMVVLDISHPLTTRFVSRFQTDGSLNDLWLAGNTVFLSEGSRGIQVIDVTNPEKPLILGAFSDLSNALAIQGEWLRDQDKYAIYVADDTQGLRVLSGVKAMTFRRAGVSETDGTATLAMLKTQLGGRISSDSLTLKVRHTLVQVTFDVLLMGGLGLLLWIIFFAQFILPVTTFKERISAIITLFFYMLRQYGPAVHIREGKVVQSPGEETRRGPGVVLVDLASAAVLEQRENRYPLLLTFLLKPPNIIFKRLARIFKKEKTAVSPRLRVIGPGITFTRFRPFPFIPKYDEKIQGVVDLRPQVRVKPDIHAYTNDGIEVICNVFSLFTLGQPADVIQVVYVGEQEASNLLVVSLTDKYLEDPQHPGRKRLFKVIESLSDELDMEDKLEIHRYAQAHRGDPSISSESEFPHPQEAAYPFLVDPARIFAAAYARAESPNGDRMIEWTELPTQVATDIFRAELASKFYNNLYEPDLAKEFGLSETKKKFANKVRNQGVLAFQWIEWPDIRLEKDVIWDQSKLVIHPRRDLITPKLLRTRGIKVITAGFTELVPVDRQVREQLVKTWQAGWQTEAEKIKADHELQAMRIRNDARVQAQRDMINTIQQLLQNRKLTQEALAFQIFQSLENAAADPGTQRLLPADTINLLKSFREWFFPPQPLFSSLTGVGGGGFGPSAPTLLPGGGPSHSPASPAASGVVQPMASPYVLDGAPGESPADASNISAPPTSPTMPGGTLPAPDAGATPEVAPQHPNQPEQSLKPGDSPAVRQDQGSQPC